MRREIFYNYYKYQVSGDSPHANSNSRELPEGSKSRLAFGAFSESQAASVYLPDIETLRYLLLAGSGVRTLNVYGVATLYAGLICNMGGGG